MMSPEILLLTLTLAGSPVADAAAPSEAPEAAARTQATSDASGPRADAPEPVAAETTPAGERTVQMTEVEAVEPGAAALTSAPEPEAPLTSVSEPVASEEVNFSFAPRASVVPSRAVPVRWAGIGITLVGVGSYIGGQLVMDAADRMPDGPAKKERSDSGRSLRGGGLGAVITGVSIWLISNELARWEEAPPASIGFVPVGDGGAVTFTMGLP